MRLTVLARRIAGAGVLWQACRDMFSRLDLSSPAVENTSSPQVHTGTEERGPGGLERGEHTERLHQHPCNEMGMHVYSPVKGMLPNTVGE